MAQIHTRKTKINGKNGVAVEITKRGKGERTADNTSLLELFTDFQTAQEDKGNLLFDSPRDSVSSTGDELQQLLDGCNSQQAKAILDIAKSAKTALEKYY